MRFFRGTATALCGLAFVLPGVLSQTRTLCLTDIRNGSPSTACTLQTAESVSNGVDNNTQDGSGGEGTSKESITSASTSAITSAVVDGVESPKKSNTGANTGAIVGGVVGGVVVLALIAGFIFMLRRKRNRDAVHHESVPIPDKSRASSPTSHTSPVYGSANPAIPPPQQPQQQQQQQPAPMAAVPVPVQHQQQLRGMPEPVLAPMQPQHAPQHHVPAGPMEIGGREVDPDGVSVSSFDMQPPEAHSVPRLPVYQRGTPPGSAAGL